MTPERASGQTWFRIDLNAGTGDGGITVRMSGAEGEVPDVGSSVIAYEPYDEKTSWKAIVRSIRGGIVILDVDPDSARPLPESAP